MKNNKRGFTLIELLVVVLIIGILAAIALPQYQVAVDKARFMEMVVGVDALVKAEEIYYSTNGKYTTQLDDLTVDLALPPSPAAPEAAYALDKGGYITINKVDGIRPDGTHADERYVYGYDKLRGVQYMAFLDHHEGRNASVAGGRYCAVVGDSNPRGIRLCKSLGKQATENVGLYDDFDRYYKMK